MDLFHIKPFIPAVTLLAWCTMSLHRRRAWCSLGAGLLTMAVLELGAYALVRRGEYNLWLYNIYLCLQMPLMAWFIHNLSMSHWLKRTTLFAVLMSAGTLSLEYTIVDVRTELLAASATVNSAVLTILFTWVLFELAGDERQPVLRVPRFWMALVHLLYFGCTIPITGLLNYLNRHDMQLADRLYVVNDILYVIFFAVLIGLFLGPLGKWRHRTNATG